MTQLVLQRKPSVLFSSQSHHWSKSLALYLASHTREKISLVFFSAIVNSGCGYVPYSTLVQTVGSVQVDKMIEQNIIQYRPEAIFYTDLQPFPETSVVTATGMHALRAMEALLLRYPPDIP